MRIRKDIKMEKVEKKEFMEKGGKKKRKKDL